MTCLEIAGKSYLTTNLTQECTPYNYSNYIKIGIPILIIQIIVPLILFMIIFIYIRKNKI